MYEKDVLNAIYSNSMHEYIVIDRNFHVLHYSDNLFTLLVTDKSLLSGADIFNILPELVGIETTIEDIFDMKSESFLIPCIFKQPNSYINIQIYPGKIDIHDSMEKCQTLVILLGDITAETLVQQKVMQERNEKVLLLDEIAYKNEELKRLNEHMQEIIDEEIKKNLEKQKMVELQSRHSQMGEMIAMITHQWKQPLSSINMASIKLNFKYYADTLDKKTFDMSMKTISEQTKYMDHTIKDFQQFFNPVKEKIDFNLSEAIATVLNLVQHEFDINNIALVVDSHKDILAYGYPNEYHQVLISILSNAKDAFLENAHNDMKINISIRRINQRSMVTIRDNAGGISEEIIDDIFNLYMTTKPEGSGLGLNISKSIIESNMDGILAVKNVNGGAEFSIVL